MDPLNPVARPRPAMGAATRAALVAGLLSFATGAAVGLSVGTRIVRGPTVSRGASAEPSVASARRVRMAALLRERAGVTTAPVQRRTLTPTLDAVGSVEFNRDRVAEVGSRVAGRVARMLVGVGATVQAGQALAEIESAAVSEALADYVAAQAAVLASRAESARLARLAADRLVTAREVEQHHAQLVAHEAAQRGALQRLLAAGFSQGEAQALARSPGAARVTLRAPIAGRVVSREVVLGQVVEPTTTVLEIADPASLWVQLEVFERDLARVSLGAAVEIQTDAHPDITVRGTVAHIATSVSHATRTARVRIELDNASGALRPGQFVRARVLGGDGRSREGITVPRDAIVQVEGRPSAFVAVADGEFELRPLELGATDGDAVEVLRGVDVGEALVTRGAFALKSELLR